MGARQPGKATNMISLGECRANARLDGRHSSGPAAAAWRGPQAPRCPARHVPCWLVVQVTSVGPACAAEESDTRQWLQEVHGQG